MALQTLGTTTTTVLRALPAFSAALSASDLARIQDMITDDRVFGAILGGYSAGATAVLTTGATHTNTTLDTLVATGGAGLASIHVGDMVLAADVPPGTFVARLISSTSVQLSAAATGSNSERVAFVRPQAPGLVTNGLLSIPNRGMLKVLPGDIIALDNTGWPILVSKNAVGYAGSQWVLT
ncbi:MAG: hypothetical protein D4R58_01870 [Betaproteobacteria bacterium]|nr:MAG: hypothetical protein D4R58_01870 [Betaproteobacteria bacterium]